MEEILLAVSVLWLSAWQFLQGMLIIGLFRKVKELEEKQ